MYFKLLQQKIIGNYIYLIYYNSMLPLRFSLSRFCLTYGLLFLAVILPVTVYYQPLKQYIDDTQQRTSSMAKSRTLGYITPDFKQLAQNILEGHVFKPEELDAWADRHRYLSFYKKGAELFPNLFEMYYMEGVCQLWMGDSASAEASLRQSLQINPVFFWSYYNLGLLYLKNGQTDSAIALFAQAKQIPIPITAKILHDIQAFYTVWLNMPDPENYINGHLQQANRQINYLMMVALAIKNNRAADAHFDPDQWNPVFF